MLKAEIIVSSGYFSVLKANQLPEIYFEIPASPGQLHTHVRSHKVKIYKVPAKAKSREPAYSHVFITKTNSTSV